MEDSEKLNETSLPEKKDFYNHLNMEDVTDTLFLAHVFESYRNMHLEIYELDPAKFFLAPGLAWQAASKKIKVKLDLLTDIDILLMVEKGLRGRIYHAVHQYVTANNKYMKDYDKNKESLYLQYWNVNNLYGWVMSQKRPENNFELVKVLLNLMKIL